MSEDNPNQASSKLTRKTAIVILLCVSPLFFVFAVLGDPGRGRAACICAGMTALGARMFWDLGKRIPFWLTLTILTLAQIPIVMFNPWGGKSYPGAALLPIALVDLAIIWGALKLVERITRA
ncbi:MAG: hypothetical protein ABR987_16080 [Terracidiphilus sp.]